MRSVDELEIVLDATPTKWLFSRSFKHVLNDDFRKLFVLNRFQIEKRKCWPFGNG